MGPVQYQVKLGNSALHRCHADHLLAANCPLLEEAEEERQEGDVEIGKRMEAPGEEGGAAPVEEEDVVNFEDSTPTVEEHSSEATQEHTTGEPESREQDHGRIPESGSMADSHASPAGTEASQDNSATELKDPPGSLPRKTYPRRNRIPRMPLNPSSY